MWIELQESHKAKETESVSTRSDVMQDLQESERREKRKSKMSHYHPEISGTLDSPLSLHETGTIETRLHASYNHPCRTITLLSRQKAQRRQMD
jgi:hypothetical protein